MGAVFAAIIYALAGGCAWRALPPRFGASKSTVHRRFLNWSRAGVWGRLHQKVLELLDGQGLVDLSRAVLDSAHPKKRGTCHRRLSPGYERHPRNHLAYVGLAATLCCYRRLGELTHLGHGVSGVVGVRPKRQMCRRREAGCTESNDYLADLAFLRLLALKRAFF